MCKLTPDETELVLNARSQWAKERIPLEENLPIDMVTRLRRYFDFKESGIYNLVVEAPVAGGTANAKRVLVVTLPLSRSLTRGKNLEYYEWHFLR